ncbi:MAG: patatin-like phospholipase family protein [Deltaproteobacteria bacterium]|nr:patatin-like phospholipase family protein [Deltaproteobacteria bacterium]
MERFKYLFIFSFIVFFTVSGCTPTTLPPAPKPARIAVVLGAGAAKGFAHIGVLKVLESQKIPIHMIVGTSAGSFVGSLYAYSHDAFKLQTMSFAIEKDHVVDLMLPDNGFIRGEKLEAYINRQLKGATIEKLAIPFYAVATDIQSGQEMVFGSGNTGRAVRASCSVPGVFKPVNISGRMYVDGGVVSPLAVDVAKRYGADVIIAVDIASAIGGEAPQGTLDTILQSIGIMYAKISAIQRLKADVVITPKVGTIGSSDFSKRHEAVLEGEKAAQAALPAILEIINKLKQEGRLP